MVCVVVTIVVDVHMATPRTRLPAPRLEHYSGNPYTARSTLEQVTGVVV